MLDLHNILRVDNIVVGIKICVLLYKITDYGVNPFGTLDNDACFQTDEIKYCNSIIDHEKATRILNEKCLGEFYCMIDDVNQFLIKEGGPEICIHDYAQFYLQLKCEFTPQQLKDRNNWNIWFCIQVIVSSLFILVLMHYLRVKTITHYRNWDAKTTLVSDYTLKYKIPSKLFKDFCENIYPSYRRNSNERKLSHSMVKQRTKYYDESDSNEQEGESVMFMFKIFLKNEIESILKQTEHVVDNNQELIKISHIHLMFNYVDLHYLLKDRGTALKDENKDQVIKIEERISKFVESKKEQICIPQEAYIIFETEEAFQRAIKYNISYNCGKKIVTRKLRGEKLELCNIEEPSNITFENKFKSPMKSFLKYIQEILCPTPNFEKKILIVGHF